MKPQVPCQWICALPPCARKPFRGCLCLHSQSWLIPTALLKHSPKDTFSSDPNFLVILVCCLNHSLDQFQRNTFQIPNLTVVLISCQKETGCCLETLLFLKFDSTKSNTPKQTVKTSQKRKKPSAPLRTCSPNCLGSRGRKKARAQECPARPGNTARQSQRPNSLQGLSSQPALSPRHSGPNSDTCILFFLATKDECSEGTFHFKYGKDFSSLQTRRKKS